MKKIGLVVFLVVVVLLVSACQAAAPAPAPAPTPAPTPAPAPTPTPTSTLTDNAAAGRQLFIDKGCAACHGQNAEGTDIAPALPGHNAEQVKRTVRSPKGNMPRFSFEQISDDELEMIAAYTESLASDTEHREPVAMEDALVVHHWMALYALEADNEDEAEHHVRHILEIITDPEHKAQMEEVIEHLQAGDVHDASHAIEEMLAGKAESGLSLQNLHLQMALASIEADEMEDTKHHLEHFVDMATGDEKARGEEAIDLLEQGNIHDAEHEVEELME